MKRTLQLALPLLLAGMAAGGTFALARPTAAAPYFERYSSAMCVPNYPQNGSHSFPIGTGTAAEIQNISSGIVYVTCPVPAKSDLPASQITAIDVYVRDGNDNGTSQSTSYQVMLRACSTAQGSAACGTTKWSSGNTYQTLSLSAGDLSQLDTYDQPYLYLALPPVDGIASGIVGATFSKP